MGLIDFDLADGSCIHWYMERCHTIRDVRMDITAQTGQDHGALFINGDKLDDDLKYNEVMFLLICKKVKEVEHFLKKARDELDKAEASVANIRLAACSTMLVGDTGVKDDSDISISTDSDIHSRGEPQHALGAAACRGEPQHAAGRHKVLSVGAAACRRSRSMP